MYQNLWYLNDDRSVIRGVISQFDHPTQWLRTIDEQMFCRNLEEDLIKAYRKINRMEKSGKTVLRKDLITIEFLSEIVRKAKLNHSIKAAALESLGYLSGFNLIISCSQPCSKEIYQGPILVTPPGKDDYEKVGNSCFVIPNRRVMPHAKLSKSCVLLKERKYRFSRKSPIHAYIQLDRSKNLMSTYLEGDGMSLNSICPYAYPDQEVVGSKSLSFKSVDFIELGDILYEKAYERVKKKLKKINLERVVVQNILQNTVKI